MAINCCLCLCLRSRLKYAKTVVWLCSWIALRNGIVQTVVDIKTKQWKPFTFPHCQMCWLCSWNASNRLHRRSYLCYMYNTYYHHTTTVLRPFFSDHPCEPVPEDNFWTLWCKGRLTEADTLTIRLDATPSGLNILANFLQAGCPSCRPTGTQRQCR